MFIATTMFIVMLINKNQQEFLFFSQPIKNSASSI